MPWLPLLIVRLPWVFAEDWIELRRDVFVCTIGKSEFHLNMANRIRNN
jgi:hypothetical protein